MPTTWPICIRACQTSQLWSDCTFVSLQITKQPFKISITRPSDDYFLSSCKCLRTQESLRLSPPTHLVYTTSLCKFYPLFFQTHKQSEGNYTEGLLLFGSQHQNKAHSPIHPHLVFHITLLRGHEYPVLQDWWLPGQLITAPISLSPILAASIKHVAALMIFCFSLINQLVSALDRRASGRIGSIKSWTVKEKGWHKAKSSCLLAMELLWWGGR